MINRTSSFRQLVTFFVLASFGAPNLAVADEPITAAPVPNNLQFQPGIISGSYVETPQILTLDVLEQTRLYTDQNKTESLTVFPGDTIETEVSTEFLGSVVDQNGELNAEAVTTGLAQSYGRGLVPVTIKQSQQNGQTDRVYYMEAADASRLDVADVNAADDAGVEEDDGQVETEGQVCENCNQGQNGTPRADALRTNERVTRNTRNASLAGVIRSRFAGYSNAATTRRMMTLAMQYSRRPPSYSGPYVIRTIRNRRGQVVRRGMTYCYRAVKNAMRDSGMVPRSFTGGANGRNAGAELAPFGYTNILTNPRYQDIADAIRRNPNLAPKGAVMVYVNTRDASHPGHVELKVGESGEGGYVSYSYSPTANYGLVARGTRRLVGVMIRL